MKTINLKNVIESQNLDIKEVAQHLFPKNKYPGLALNRVISGGAVLDANQISKLSDLTGITISDLFFENSWKLKSKNNVHVFTNGSFTSQLDMETWTTKVFHKDSLFHETVMHCKSIILNDYLNELNSIIANHNKTNHETNRV